MHKELKYLDVHKRFEQLKKGREFNKIKISVLAVVR
jgi:hypothetical protein